jgi:hypothetical protein
MASNNRQAEETRIRRALETNSFDLVALEKYLEQNHYIPDTVDEQAAGIAVFELREIFDRTVSAFRPGSLHANVNNIFVASDSAVSDVEVQESESVKYDAVKDLILMLAARKVQASAAHTQQGSGGSHAVVKQERA